MTDIRERIYGDWSLRSYCYKLAQAPAIARNATEAKLTPIASAPFFSDDGDEPPVAEGPALGEDPEAGAEPEPDPEFEPEVGLAAAWSSIGVAVSMAADCTIVTCPFFTMLVQ